MNEQNELFKHSAGVKKPIPIEQMESERYTEAYCLHYLETVPCLWDMRAWLNYKDKAEVAAYVREPSRKNDGHSQFCVEKLKKLRMPEARIAQAIMNNPNIAYKNRLGACFLKLGKCSRLNNAGGNYSKCACWKCEGKSNPLKQTVIHIERGS